MRQAKASAVWQEGGLALSRAGCPCQPWLCAHRPAACLPPLRPAGFLEHVAAARGKTKEEVAAFLDEGVFDMEVFKQRGFVDDLK